MVLHRTTNVFSAESLLTLQRNVVPFFNYSDGRALNRVFSMSFFYFLLTVVK